MIVTKDFIFIVWALLCKAYLKKHFSVKNAKQESKKKKINSKDKLGSDLLKWKTKFCRIKETENNRSPLKMINFPQMNSMIDSSILLKRSKERQRNNSWDKIRKMSWKKKEAKTK